MFCPLRGLIGTRGEHLRNNSPLAEVECAGQGMARLSKCTIRMSGFAPSNVNSTADSTSPAPWPRTARTRNGRRSCQSALWPGAAPRHGLLHVLSRLAPPMESMHFCLEMRHPRTHFGLDGQDCHRRPAPAQSWPRKGRTPIPACRVAGIACPLNFSIKKATKAGRIKYKSAVSDPERRYAFRQAVGAQHSG
jgi:hypothetical protein